MVIGTTVIFKGEMYTVMWLYDNGTCEIKKKDSFGKVELVSLSEINPFKVDIPPFSAI